MNQSTLRRTAAEIAAAAVFELYPDVELLGGGETSLTFFYDFFIAHPIHLEVVEEKMRQIVRERRPIRTLEMVSFSAGELLKKEGHLARRDALEEGMVELIQIGSFYDLCPGPHLKNTAELAAFKISLEPLPERHVRLTGWCASSKEELKEFLKKLKHYTDPIQIGERMGFWKGDIWLGEGIRMRQRLIQILKTDWFSGAVEVSGPPNGDRIEMHRSLGKGKVAEVWVDPPSSETKLQVSFFGQSEKELISSLHSIGKTLTILGFDHSTVSTGQGTDYLVKDELGRNWPVVHIKNMTKKGSSTVDFVWTAAVEKIFYLLLEKNLFLKMVDVENK